MAEKERSEDPVVGDEEVRRCKVSVAVGGKHFQASTPTAQTDLVLTRTKIIFATDPNGGKEAKVVLLEDLIGIHVEQKPPLNNPLACQVEFRYYPMVRTGLSRRRQSRKRLSFQVQFDSANTFRDNLYTAKEWEKAINLQCHHTLKLAFYPEEYGAKTADQTAASGEAGEGAAGLEKSEGVPEGGELGIGEDGRKVPELVRIATENKTMSLAPRDLLVLINPIGGQGKAESEFHKHVRPLFDQANIKFETIVTERRGHAYDLMKDFDVSRIDGIVLASGDGLLYEVINGLMEREDWETAIKTPIGMLPLGSGNALCAATLYESKEEFSLENAVFQIIRGGTTPMDISTVHTCDGKRHYMALLNCWGFIADVDIESEKWRKIGEARFILGALNCIRRKRVYRGRLHYLPEDEPSTETTQSATDAQPTSDAVDQPPRAEDKQTTETDKTEQATTAVSFKVEDAAKEEQPVVSGTQGEPDDGEGGRSKEGQQTGTSLGVDISPGQSEHPSEPLGAHIYPSSYSQALKAPVVVEQQTGSDDVDGASKEAPQPVGDEEVRSKPVAVTGPPTTLLPRTLSDPVPDNWKTIEGEFVLFVGLMISHLAKGAFGDPEMSMGTGKVRVRYMTREMPRLRLLSMLASGNPDQVNQSESSGEVDTKAYRLEPITSPGMMTIDGEVVQYGPIQVQVHKHLARVMCRKRQGTEIPPT